MPLPPLIGVTAGNDPEFPGRYIVRWDYIHAVSAAGGVPAIVAPCDAANEDGYVEHFAGLLFTGGCDIRPMMYGRLPGDASVETDRERDEFERKLILSSMVRGIPVLGIGRGLQVLNVALGGDLVHDIPTNIGDRIAHDHGGRSRTTLAHDVAIEMGSSLHRICGERTFAVNSMHHQSAGKLGKGIAVSAMADDGVVEAIEMPGEDFVLAVQWHPETFWKQGPPFSSIFDALVNAAKRRTL